MRRNARFHSESGTVLPAVIGLMMIGLLLVGLVFELARWGSLWRETAFVAEAAAEAGAATIDLGDLRSGTITLSPDLAIASAVTAGNEARPRPDRVITAAVPAPDLVCVDVSQEYSSALLRLFGADSMQVSATACASPTRG
jgi:Putative Tad-like Flp pilus-assembly